MSMNQNENVIKVEGVSKTFKLPHEKRSSVKGAFVNLFRRQTYEKQQVLKNISFEIKKGEFFGIVGRNGSGKSTILKLIAGIYTPTKGQISINGTLTPFIELGVGFNPELTGRENVFLNGALLGFNRKEMFNMYNEIVEFAELEKFMDQKLKNYSSGMQVRLAFAIAIQAKNDILVLDEILAVGDANFQKKCFNYFNELRRAGTTVILVTHDMSSVVNFCSRAMYLEDGRIVTIGPSAQVASVYQKSNLDRQENTQSSDTYKDKNLSINEVSIFSSKGIKTKSLKPLHKYRIEIEINNKSGSVENVGLGFSIKTVGGVPIAGFNSYTFDKEQSKVLHKVGKHKITYTFVNRFKNGSYSINVGIHQDLINNKTGGYDLLPLIIKDNAAEFVSSGWLPPGTIMELEAKATIE